MSLTWGGPISGEQVINVVLTKLDALYFSVVTFTTTGFGDIAPRSTQARAFVTAQSGLTFLLVTIAITVAIAGAFARRDESPST